MKGPPEEVDTVVEREAEKYLQAVISSIPANEDRLDVYRQAQAEDTEYSKLIDFASQESQGRNQTVLASKRRTDIQQRLALAWS